MIDANVQVAIRRGALYFDAALYDCFFAPLQGVALLQEESNLLVMPLRLAGAGGYLVKMRNARGDRVVAAPEFFRDRGLDDGCELQLPAAWNDARAALVVMGAFSNQ